MELLQLEYFIRVAKLEHVSKAAEELHISQPALSLTIRRLEDELGVSLFERRGRNIKLTQYGTLFLSKVEPAWNQLTEATSEVRHLKRTNENKITIVSPPLYAFPGLLPQLNKLCPEVIISSLDTDRDDSMEKLRSHKIDLCIVSRDENTPIDPAFECEILRREKVVLVVPKGYKFSGRKHISLTEITNEPMAVYPSGRGFRPLMDEKFHQLGCNYNVMFEASTAFELIEAVRSQLCVTLIQESVAKHYSPVDIERIPIDDPPFISCLKMLRLKDTKPRPVVSTIQKIIRAYFEEFPL